jgi:hypothetical protein
MTIICVKCIAFRNKEQRCLSSLIQGISSGLGCVSLRVVSDDDDDDNKKSLYLRRSIAAMRWLVSFLFRIWETESQIKVGQVSVSSECVQGDGGTVL